MTDAFSFYQEPLSEQVPDCNRNLPVNHRATGASIFHKQYTYRRYAWRCAEAMNFGEATILKRIGVHGTPCAEQS